MRKITFISLVIFGLSYTTPKDAGQANSKLDGTWIPVKQEIGGKELPKAVYEKQKLVIVDSNYIVTAESVDKGIVKYGDANADYE